MTNWLLLRGLTRDQRHWEGFPDEFRTRLGATVRTIDPPGFGTQNTRTSPRSVPAITDDIRARFRPEGSEWSLLGISLGGMMAMDWCARYPDDFQRCVVVNTSARETLDLRRLNPRVLPVLAGRSFRSDHAHESAVLGLTSNSPRVDREALAHSWARYQQDARPSTASILGQLVAAATFRLPQRIPVPLLVLAAAGDRLAPHHMSEAIAARYGAPLHLHPDAGHDLPLDDAGWVLDRIADWLPAT